MESFAKLSILGISRGPWPANFYFFRKKCGITSKLTIKTPERRLCGGSKGLMKALRALIKPFEAPQRPRSGVFNVNFEHISHCFLVFLLLTLNR